MVAFDAAPFRAVFCFLIWLPVPSPVRAGNDGGHFPIIKIGRAGRWRPYAYGCHLVTFIICIPVECLLILQSDCVIDARSLNGAGLAAIRHHRRYRY